MPRKNLIRTNQFPYHVTSRCHNKQWFELPMGRVWKLLKQSLKEANSKFPIELINMVLMNNHYHMILRTPEANLDLFMREFNRRFAIKLRNEGDGIDNVFGSRYKWCVISSEKYFINCYRYVYQNPVRSRLCSSCEEYAFSTLKYILSDDMFCIPIIDKYGFKDEWGLRWLNQSIPDNEFRAIDSGLRRSEFQKIS